MNATTFKTRESAFAVLSRCMPPKQVVEAISGAKAIKSGVIVYGISREWLIDSKKVIVRVDNGHYHYPELAS